MEEEEEDEKGEYDEEPRYEKQGKVKTAGRGGRNRRKNVENEDGMVKKK